MEVQLIIKAPNQNVDDHIVNCTLDWSVKALKDHLSTAYPNKPAPKDQKLIYSGHLLPDHLFLKEFLRQDETQSSVYILHLVYNGNSPITENPVSNLPESNLAEISTTILSSGQSSENLLRHRSATSMPLPPQTSTFYQSPASPPLVPAFIPDSQTAAQLAAMQQMYAYYFTQYLQGSQPSAVAENNPAVSPEIANSQQNVASNQPVQRQEIAQGARRRAEENEEWPNRDWLDHLFLGLRFLLFFSLVHFYTSPERLMIVIVCAVVLFLYHEGWFVRRRPPIVAAESPQVQPDRANVPQQRENEHLTNQDPGANDEMSGENEIQATMDGNNPPHAQQVGAEDHQISSPLTYITTFFASLIPEPPPAVNIN